MYNNNILLLLFMWMMTSMSSRCISAQQSPSNLRTSSNRNLVIGGHDATQDRYPYYVALQNAENKTECGGTLIAPDVVLTAAHCRGYVVEDDVVLGLID